MTNITSGRPASYSSKTSATLCCRPRAGCRPEFGDLLAVLDDDRVLADEIDTADMAVEVDAHAGPVEAGGDLLDMGRFAGAVIARDHHAAVVREAGENGERGGAVEEIVRDRNPAHAIDLVHSVSTRVASDFAGNRIFFGGGLKAFSDQMKVGKRPRP
jgi:hypothetical protein